MDFEKVDGLEVLYGDELLADIEGAAGLPRRDCFGKLKEYLGSPVEKLLLYGLRRTGKTVMAKQAMAELPKDAFARTVFIKATQGLAIPCTPAYELVKDLWFEGFRTFFIDECTALTDFPAWTKMVSDGIAARGCHVVLLGMDSLAMWIAEREFLEGRHRKIRTTRIPCHEWRRLLEVKSPRRLGVEDYVRYGGILDFDGVPPETELPLEPAHSFRDPASIDWYVHSAIALNIQNSLARHASGKDFGPLRDLWEGHQLHEAIARIVQKNNHELAFSDLRVPFILEDYYKARGVALELDSNAGRAFKKLNADVRRRINECLCIGGNGQEMQITVREANEIRRYLQKIDVFKNAEVLTMPSTMPEKRRDKPRWQKGTRTLQTQSGIRAGQMRLACGMAWNIMKISGVPIPLKDFLKKAEVAVQGQMLEDIVFADLQDVLPNGCRMFKLEWNAAPGERAEFDVAVVDERDPASPRVSLFEVKHTESDRGCPEKHMKNPCAIAQVAESFGRVVSRTIVYNGPTERRAVLWVNADEFLEAVGKNPEACLFPQLSERWSPLCSFEPWLAAAADPDIPAECTPAPEPEDEPDAASFEAGCSLPRRPL